MLLRKFYPVFLSLLLVSIASCEKDEVQTECMDFNLVLNEDVELGSDIMVMADELLSTVEGATYTWIIEEPEEKHEISGSSTGRLNWSPNVGETQFCLMVEIPGCDGSTACFTYTLEAMEVEENTSAEETTTENDAASSQEDDENSNEENSENEDEDSEGEESQNGEGSEEDADSDNSEESDDEEEDSEENNNEDEANNNDDQNEDNGNGNNDEGNSGGTEDDADNSDTEDGSSDPNNEGSNYSPNCLGDMQRIFLTSCHFRVDNLTINGNDETQTYTDNNSLLKFNSDGSMEITRFTGTANEVNESFGTWGSLAESCQLQISPVTNSLFNGNWNFEFSADGNTLQLVIDDNNKAVLIRNCKG